MGAKMQLEAAVVGLLVLVVVCWLPSSSEAAAQELGIYDWVTQQPAAATGCAEKKDAALSAAERVHINNVIDPSGSDESSYKTIGESVANIPDGSTKRYVLTLMPGVVYREKVLIGKSKPFVTIRSRDPYNPAVIVWNDTAARRFQMILSSLASRDRRAYATSSDMQLTTRYHKFGNVKKIIPTHLLGYYSSSAKRIISLLLEGESKTPIARYEKAWYAYAILKPIISPIESVIATYLVIMFLFSI